jgi:hypothetical protein
MPTEIDDLDRHLPLRTWNSEWRVQVLMGRSAREGDKSSPDTQTDHRLVCIKDERICHTSECTELRFSEDGIALW